MKRSIWKLLIASSLLISCKTPKTFPYPSFKGGESRVENRMATSASLDSTYHRDSIFVREYTRGDTVYLDRWRDRWRERTLTRTDTVWQDREVRIQLPPERYVPRAVKVLAWIGGAAIGLLLLWVIRDLPAPTKGGVFRIWKGL